jgi:hypothetical protein
VSPRSIAVMARDAGAAAALAPVARELIERGDRVSIVAHGKAATAFELRRLPVLAFPGAPSHEQIEGLLVRHRTDVLLTGTSMKAAADRAWWDAARAHGIANLALVDHWSNLSERFSHREDFDSLPDVIAVMDHNTVEALVAAGCPADRIRVTGQPYFDNLAHSSILARRPDARRDLGVENARVVIVFASEPQARYYGSGPDDPRWLGYTEHDVLDLVSDAAREVTPDALLIVKLHPLEDDEAFVDLADHGIAGGPEIRILRAYPTSDLIAAADAVVGMTSIFLLESATLGVPTVSVRPGGGEDPYIGAHAGRIVSITDRTLVASELRSALRSGGRAPDQGLAFAEASIQNVIALIGEQAARAATPGIGSW